MQPNALPLFVLLQYLFVNNSACYFWLLEAVAHYSFVQMCNGSIFKVAMD
jgi:hypothetical protein